MTEKKKTFSTAEVGFSGRVSFDLTQNESVRDDGTVTKIAHAVISCKNQAQELKFYAEKLGGNPDALRVVTGKDGDEYVSIRLTGFNGVADKMLAEVHKGDLIDVRGKLSRMTTADYNGETQLNMVVNYFRIIAGAAGAPDTTVNTADGDDEIVALTQEALDAPEAEVDALSNDDLPF